MKTAFTVLLLVFVSTSTWANNPGQHNIVFTWQDASCDADPVNCSFNMYQATSSGACGPGKTPLVKNIAPIPGADGYLQSNVAPGTYFTAFTAVDQVTGGESTCSNEVQTSVPSITTKPPTNATGTVQ